MTTPTTTPTTMMTTMMMTTTTTTMMTTTTTMTMREVTAVQHWLARHPLASHVASAQSGEGAVERTHQPDESANGIAGAERSSTSSLQGECVTVSLCRSSVRRLSLRHDVPLAAHTASPSRSSSPEQPGESRPRPSRARSRPARRPRHHRRPLRFVAPLCQAQRPRRRRSAAQPSAPQSCHYRVACGRLAALLCRRLRRRRRRCCCC